MRSHPEVITAKDQRDPWWTTSLPGAFVARKHRTWGLQERSGGHNCREDSESWKHLLRHMEFYDVFFFVAQSVMLVVVCLVAQNAPNILWEGCLDPRNIQMPTPKTVSEGVWSRRGMFFVDRFWVSLVGHEHCQIADIWEERHGKIVSRLHLLHNIKWVVLASAL